MSKLFVSNKQMQFLHDYLYFVTPRKRKNVIKKRVGERKYKTKKEAMKEIERRKNMGWKTTKYEMWHGEHRDRGLIHAIDRYGIET